MVLAGILLGLASLLPAERWLYPILRVLVQARSDWLYRRSVLVGLTQHDTPHCRTAGLEEGLLRRKGLLGCAHFPLILRPHHFETVLSGVCSQVIVLLVPAGGSIGVASPCGSKSIFGPRE